MYLTHESDGIGMMINEEESIFPLKKSGILRIKLKYQRRYWPMIEIVDISLVDGIPAVLDVLNAIRVNFVIG